MACSSSESNKRIAKLWTRIDLELKIFTVPTRRWFQMYGVTGVPAQVQMDEAHEMIRYEFKDLHLTS